MGVPETAYVAIYTDKYLATCRGLPRPEAAFCFHCPFHQITWLTNEKDNIACPCCKREMSIVFLSVFDEAFAGVCYQ